MQKGAPEIPVLRLGNEYRSLERRELSGHRDGVPRGLVGQANAGLIRRDARRLGAAAAALRAIPAARLLERVAAAGEIFLDATLPLSEGGAEQSPQDYVEALSATSGLPRSLCRRNMEKVHGVFSQMPTILRGLTRGMDLAVLDGGLGEHSGVRVSYAPAGSALGVVLPSNSPGVNSLWMPSIALKTPVVLKPGREEPWTPLRIIRAFLAAGLPREAFGFYPTDHEGAATILEVCDRALLFGDASTTAPWAGDPTVEIHGPGRSKVVLGPDAMARWRDWLPVLVASILDNGGRSCINASAVRVPSHADDVADALARELAAVEPADFADEGARLAAFANPRIAEAIDGAIDAALAKGGAEDVTARYRKGGRRRSAFGAEFLLPTVVRCDSLDHPLANTEYLFPFASVVQVPARDLVATLGPSLVVTALTRDPALLDELSRCADVQRLNVGPIPTSRVEWDQPHEGNLFEFLWTRRAYQRDPAW